MYSQNICILQTSKHITHKQYFNESLITDAPVPEPVKTIYGLQLERTALVTVTVQSNPRPNTQWNINNNIFLNEGDTRERYEAQVPEKAVSINARIYEIYMRKILFVLVQGDGKWNVTLVIDKLTLEDTTKSYKLIAGNQLGREEYTIKISGSDAPICTYNCFKNINHA